MQIKNKTFSFVTLGCRTNIAESNDINNQLITAGLKKVKDIATGTFCIINSCCVTSKVEAKTRYFINKGIRSQKCKLIILMGCFSQIYPNQITDKKVGIILGNKQKTSIVDLLKNYKPSHRNVLVELFSKSDKFEEWETYSKSNHTRAFLKIQDGCDFMCSYCIIPFARGRQRSLPHKKVISRIKELVNNGYKEIILTGVNTAGYFENKNYGFYELIKDINELPGNFRIRISSLEPFQISYQLINIITSNKERWCQHLHICIQSACDSIISTMKRKYTVKSFIDLCNYIRSRSPLMSITTDCIVGFPTETEQNFQESKGNLKLIHFSDIHIFPFSSRPFTAAGKSKNIVSVFQRKQRFNEINNLNKIEKHKYLVSFIDKTVTVLFEKSPSSTYQVGHSEYFFNVKVLTKIVLTNQLRKIKITKVIDGDVYGVLI